MSLLTSFLKLFKYDPINDREKTFNITKALNENWDKIDSKVEEIANVTANAETTEGAQEKASAALESANEYTDTKMQDVNQKVETHLTDDTAHGIANKVDKVAGKQLSDTNYTIGEKVKLEGIKPNANVVAKSATNGNIIIDGTQVVVYSHPTGTNPHGTTKADIGLGNVDNIKQMPISGGTFTGNAVANVGSDYTTKRLRNSMFKAGTDFTTTELGLGDIGFVY